MEKICDHDWALYQRQYNRFDKIIRQYEWCRKCYEIRQTIGNSVERKMTLDEALAEFEGSDNPELSESLHKILTRPKQDGWQFERSFLLTAYVRNKLLQVGRKRKLKAMPELTDEAFDAYADIDSGCLSPEVRR